MNPLGHRRAPKLLTRTILTVSLLLGSTSAQTDKLSAALHRPSQHSWNLKYRSGAPGLRKDQWLKGAFLPGPAATQENNPAVSISIDELREIDFEHKAEKESASMEHMSRSGCAYAKDLMPKESSTLVPGTFVAWVTSPHSAKRAAEHLNLRYPMRLVWSDGGSRQELVFSVRSCEYASFIANLRSIVGQRWKDLEHEFPK